MYYTQHIHALTNIIPVVEVPIVVAAVPPATMHYAGRQGNQAPFPPVAGVSVWIPTTSRANQHGKIS